MGKNTTTLGKILERNRVLCSILDLINAWKVTERHVKFPHTNDVKIDRDHNMGCGLAVVKSEM